MYYMSEEGSRVYTLAKTDPAGNPTFSAHPARWDNLVLEYLTESCIVGSLQRTNTRDRGSPSRKGSTSFPPRGLHRSTNYQLESTVMSHIAKAHNMNQPSTKSQGHILSWLAELELFSTRYHFILVLIFSSSFSEIGKLNNEDRRSEKYGENPKNLCPQSC